MKVRLTIRRLTVIAAAIAVGAVTAVNGVETYKRPLPKPGAPAATSSRENGRLATTAVSRTPMGRPPLKARAHRLATPARTKVPRPADAREAEEVENGEASNGYSSRPLTYRGGPVQTTPRIYLVLWGPTWFSGGDPSGVASRLHYFYQGVSGSTWANVLEQYGSNYGAFTNPTGQYRGWVQDTT